MADVQSQNPSEALDTTSVTTTAGATEHQKADSPPDAVKGETKGNDPLIASEDHVVFSWGRHHLQPDRVVSVLFGKAFQRTNITYYVCETRRPDLHLEQPRLHQEASMLAVSGERCRGKLVQALIV
jgi:hypothetical protein